MKKILFFALSLILLSACGADKENKVETFGKNFAAYVNASQLDSIKAVYPSANFDAVIPVSADSLTVTENGNGTYRISFSGDTWVDVTVEENGDIKVLESNGFAAFPEEKYEMGKNTGMFNDNPTDVVKAERLDDSAFFEWLNAKMREKAANAIDLKAGKLRYVPWTMAEGGDGYKTCTLTNTTDHPISRNDYYLAYTDYWADGTEGDTGTEQCTHPGIDLAPGATGQIELKGQCTIDFLNIRVIYKNDSITKYTPSGTEYQEYLDSRK